MRKLCFLQLQEEPSNLPSTAPDMNLVSDWIYPRWTLSKRSRCPLFGDLTPQGTVSAAMFTCFRCFTDGCSSEYGMPLQEQLRRSPCLTRDFPLRLNFLPRNARYAMSCLMWGLLRSVLSLPISAVKPRCVRNVKTHSWIEWLFLKIAF